MQERAEMLYGGLAVLGIALVIAVCVLVKCSRCRFEFKSGTALSRAAKSLSAIPLAVNLITFVLYFAAAIMSAFEERSAIVIMLVAMILGGISATVGLAAGLLGIVFSAVLVRKPSGGRSGIGCVIGACVSLVMSVGILFLYLQALIPLYII